MLEEMLNVHDADIGEAENNNDELFEDRTVTINPVNNAVVARSSTLSPATIDANEYPEELVCNYKIIAKELTEFKWVAIQGSSFRPRHGQHAVLAKSYAKYCWDSMDERFRRIAVEAWLTGISEETRESIRAKFPKKAISVPNSNGTRAVPTSINERARVLHIFCDPENRVSFTEMFQPLTRLQLDDRENRDSAVRTIVDNYNDFIVYTYINATSDYEWDVATRTNKCTGRANLGMEIAFELCHAINPQDSTKPIRSVEWFQNTFKQFRTDYTRCHENYHKSGNHDAEDIYFEFYKFCKGSTRCLHLIIQYKLYI